jgi:hypothetical protein
LSGKRYLEFAPQQIKDALGRWTKPSCVLMGEGNYSDAFIFPICVQAKRNWKLIGWAYQAGTAVWWETN